MTEHTGENDALEPTGKMLQHTGETDERRCLCGCTLTEAERRTLNAGLRVDFGLHYAVARIADDRAALTSRPGQQP